MGKLPFVAAKHVFVHTIVNAMSFQKLPVHFCILSTCNTMLLLILPLIAVPVCRVENGMPCAELSGTSLNYFVTVECNDVVHNVSVSYAHVHVH